MSRKLLQWLGPLIVAVLFCAALWVLHRELRHYTVHQVLGYLHEVPISHVFLSLLLALLSYAVLTTYDWLALLYIRYPLHYQRIALASFIGYAFSHNIGAALLSGGSVRFRLYSAWGLSPVQIGSIVIFGGLTFLLGFLTLGGAVFVFQPAMLSTGLDLARLSIQAAGILLLAAAAVYVIFCALRRRPFHFRQSQIPIPSVRMTLAQFITSSVDWTLAGSVLFVLLPIKLDAFIPYLGVFLLAQAGGLVSHVPGGVGVFETIILVFLTPAVPADRVLGGLVLFRLVYYIIPLVIAAILLGVHELADRRAKLRPLGRILGQWNPDIIPQFLAITVFIAGAILLILGAAPIPPNRLLWVRQFIPLALIDVSHFLASVAGAALLLLSPGLQGRLSTAYRLCITILAAGIIFCLLKGLAYVQASILALTLAALAPCRGDFPSREPLRTERFNAPWTVAIALVLLLSLWLGFFAYKHVHYSPHLWWNFAFHSDVSRFLRASAGAALIILFFVLLKRMRR